MLNEVSNLKSQISKSQTSDIKYQHRTSNLSLTFGIK